MSEPHRASRTLLPRIAFAYVVVIGKRGFSAYVEAALRRQVEQDNLAELVDEYTSTKGDFTPEEQAAARAELYGTEDAGTGHAA
jgi:hypothetical protein